MKIIAIVSLSVGFWQIDIQEAVTGCPGSGPLSAKLAQTDGSYQTLKRRRKPLVVSINNDSESIICSDGV